MGRDWDPDKEAFRDRIRTLTERPAPRSSVRSSGPPTPDPVVLTEAQTAEMEARAAALAASYVRRSFYWGAKKYNDLHIVESFHVHEGFLLCTTRTAAGREQSWTATTIESHPDINWVAIDN